METDCASAYAHAFLCSELTKEGVEKVSSIILRAYIKVVENRMQARISFSKLRRQRLSNYICRMLTENSRCPSVQEIDIHWEIYFKLHPESSNIGKFFVVDEVIQEQALVLPPMEFRNIPPLKLLPLRERRLKESRRLQDFGEILRFHSPAIHVFDFVKLFPGFKIPRMMPRYTYDLQDFMPFVASMFVKLPTPPAIQSEKLPAVQDPRDTEETKEQ